ncbi:molybdate ABC transporter substrate-binding protein [Microbacterium sp. RD1]|uniref:molybdate ABC transporter substrate-binding protein n=1 Tax=Microbacterium sp. RD1 TaxID=3457313 RepID=UPI003FA55415
MHRTARRPLAAALLAGILAVAGCATAAPATAPSPSGTAGALDGTLSVYAAASLAAAFDEIAVAFEEAHPAVDVTAVYDGSATLAIQIGEGAPADVFASADEATMAKIGDAALGPELFATNTLVIAVPAGNPAGIDSLADLPAATVVLCAPEVPCGAASAVLLARAGVAVEAASLEQNVTAVRTKVAAGVADAGLVYATDVRGVDEVEAIVPARADEVVNAYPITALERARNPAAAAAFVAFVLSPAGQGILAESGFGRP